jgi:hypothetical protein
MQQRLWDLGKDKAVTERSVDAGGVLDSCGIRGDERTAMRTFDVKVLDELRMNPYLL